MKECQRKEDEAVKRIEELEEELQRAWSRFREAEKNLAEHRNRNKQ